MQVAHMNVAISDEHFDQFNRHCIQSLKEMRRIKIDGLKEILRLLQQLRENIVLKQGSVKQEDQQQQEQ
jgi:hypothetical protein